MKVLYTKSEVVSLIASLKIENKIIGFVPTMGALHSGHLSLINEARLSCDVIVASIFVNPTQFNDPKDLERYPRTLDKDLELLDGAGCDFVFAPNVEEMYPEVDNRKFDFGYIESVMEGAKRPGHFNGVAQVVSKLFDIVSPHKAYFGMKDFQQIAIINSMVKQLSYDIEIVSCPIIREADGLAMSSRNALLDENCKKSAPIIYATLKKALTFAGEKTVNELINYITNEIDSDPYLEVEYVEIVNFDNLKIVKDWKEDGKKVICVAVFAGKVRLIDNILIE